MTLPVAISTEFELLDLSDLQGSIEMKVRHKIIYNSHLSEIRWTP